MNRNFEGVWIEKDIWLNREMTLIEKVMYVDIRSLETEDRGCYASNKYFAEFLNLTPGRVSQIISGMAEKGIIQVKLIYEGSVIKERQIRLTTPLENDDGGSKFPKRGYLENCEESSTKSTNTKSSSTTTPSAPGRNRKSLITITEWLEQFGEEDEIIPPNHPSRRYAADAGIPSEFIKLGWLAFVDRMELSNKKQRDWPGTFTNYVRNNWLDTWCNDRSTGEYRLTSAGIARQRMLEAQAE